MKWLPSFKRFRSKKRKSLTASADSWTNLASFLGVSSEADLSPEATYYICRKVLSESVGKLPCKLLKKTPEGGIIEAKRNQLYDILRFRPNPYMTSTTFWSAMEAQCQHYGNSFAYIERIAHNGTRLWILPSESVQVWYDDAQLLHEASDLYYFWSSAKGVIPLTSTDVIHIKTSDAMDGLMGRSVLDQLRSTIDGMKQSQTMLNNLYKSGMTAKAVLQFTGDLSKEKRDAFVAGIEQYARGELADKGISNIIPIPIGASLTPLNIKLTDSQFLELRQYSAMQIAAAFGVKPSHIGDYSKTSYASQEAQQISFYVDTLLHRLKLYEEEIAFKLLTKKQRQQGLFVKFNEKAALRTDTKTQAEILTTYVNHGLMDHNEAREQLDLPSKPYADELVIGNGASIPLRMLGAQYLSQIQTMRGGEYDNDEKRDAEQTTRNALQSREDSEKRGHGYGYADDQQVRPGTT